MKFVTQTVGANTSIVETTGISVAQYLSSPATYDALPLGFAIVDTASAITAAIVTLAADTHLTQITSTTGGVAVSFATFKTALAALDKVVGGYAVSDTAATIQAKLVKLATDITNIQAIIPTDAPVTLDVATFVANSAILAKVSGGVVVSDTAVAVLANLAPLALDLTSVNQIVISSGPALTVNAAKFANREPVFAKVSGGVKVQDLAANIVANLGALASGAAAISKIVSSDVEVTVTVDQFLANQAALDKLKGGFMVSDTGAALQSGIDALEKDASHITGITVTSGAVTVSDASFKADLPVLTLMQSGFAVSDTAATLQNDIAALGAQSAHITGLTSTDKTMTFSVANFKAYTALLDTVTGGVAIQDTSAAITARLAALNANSAHITGIAATDGYVNVLAATFVADLPMLSKVSTGVEIADTSANFMANDIAILSNFSHVQAIDFTDAGTPSLVFSPTEAYLAQPILAKVVDNYVLNVKSGSNITTTGHGDGLKIKAIPGIDVITGGGNSEAFVFHDGFQQATITDFSAHTTAPTADSIQLDAVDFGSFQNMMNHDVTNHGANVWLTGSNGDTLVIDNMTSQTLGTLGANFKFA